ncbi:MAG: diguanylate cyclase [Thermodesulfovibrio sp.]|nr:diguanylate cyclase [Thermodesulfovibrio sp.]
MSIKRKIIFVYSLFILSLILSTVFVHQFFIRNTILDIEKNYIIEDLKKLVHYFDNEKQNLLGLTKDWASWTDAWLFMQDKNPSFIENNLTMESFINNKVNLIAYFDLKGKLKRGFEYYSETNKLSVVDEKFWGKYIEKILKITERNSLKMHSLVGFTFRNDKPYLVAVCPVLKSDSTGSVAGYLIMSRMITEEKQSSIKNFFGFRGFKIENIKDAGEELKINPAINEDSEKYRVFYRTEDFFGSYSVGFNIEKEKKLWKLVKGSNLKLITFYISCFLIFGFVFYLWFKDKIINKIINLVNHIEEVKAGKTNEVKADSKDEIGYLAQEINRYINTVKKQISEIETNRKIYETIAEQSEAIIFLFNSKGEVLFVNSKAYEILYREHHKTSAKNLFHLLSEIIQINQGEKVYLSELKLKDDLFVSGWIIPVEVEEKEKDILFIAHDITSLKKEKERLLDKAYKDSLTLLYNRAFFEFSLRKIINKVQQGEAYSLIFIDLDDLKAINDKFGHVVGDKVIQETVNSIRRSIRDDDLACRWGGDEFVVLIKGNTDIAKAVAERIQTNLKNVVLTYKNETIIPSVSIGITNIDASKDIETILREADKSAYDAKRTGKNKIKVFDPKE